MANILMLEPDAVLAKVYRQLFEYSGHEVRRSVSAQDAVFLVDELMPDVILVELQMVAHSGIEFLYELRSYSEWQHIPVLIHSCIPPTEFQDSMELLTGLLKVRAYLYKPHTTLTALLREVRDAIAAGSTRVETTASDRVAFLNSLTTQPSV
ncbi:MAG: hypothetical protein JWP13_15 [Candidatus Saccharibacteria bacterium]|nr:hypothetical protein [Candidatus Saccharibacteria bacterium]